MTFKVGDKVKFKDSFRPSRIPEEATFTVCEVSLNKSTNWVEIILSEEPTYSYLSSHFRKPTLLEVLKDRISNDV